MSTVSDPLAKFRVRSPAAPPPVTTELRGQSVASEEYVAFGVKDRVERLRIRPAKNATRAPSYQYLLDIVYDGDFGTNVVLVFTFMLVTIQGKNLQEVVMALESGTADFIQEFDPALWPKPVDDSAPCIESIEVVVKNGSDGAAEPEAVGRTAT